MRLQYQLSNGSYIDIDDPEREKMFIRRAVEFDQRLPDTFRGKRNLSTRQDAIELLEAGYELRHGSDWYDKIRDGEAYDKKLAATKAKRDNDPNFSNEGWKLDCGCIVHHRSHIMNASMGTSCTDCYDRMSN